MIVSWEVTKPWTVVDNMTITVVTLVATATATVTGEGLSLKYSLFTASQLAQLLDLLA